MTDNPSPPASGPRVHIRSFGCQMNVHDAQKMADLLAASGYREVDAPEAADLVILNTCHIREKATEKVFSELGRLRALRDERGGELMVAVAGCVAQAEGAEIQRRAPVADIVVGPQSYHRLPALIAEAKTGRRVIDTEFPAEDKFDHLPAPNRMATARRGVSSFLTVQEGCDKFCSFCVVPYTRGAEVSRPVAKILAEAAQLVASGVRELTLIGQNVNAYHGVDEAGRPADLVTLFERLSELPGLARLRYATSHPRDMSDRLMAAHRDLPKLMPYLHLPVQSGSDRILGAMNRKHTAQDYREMIAQQRRLRPDIAVSSDFIVGFPGESDADFEATLRLVSEIGFAAAYSFKYSPRPGTPAAEAADQVPEAVMAERLARLQALLNAQQGAFNAGTLGRVLPVLFEKSGRHPGQLVGKSPYLQAVHVDAPAELIGAVVDVHITGMTTNGLLGAVASESPMEGRGPAAPAEDAA